MSTTKEMTREEVEEFMKNTSKNDVVPEVKNEVVEEIKMK